MKLVAGQIVPIRRKCVVNPACTCKYLEEPVFSSIVMYSVEVDLWIPVNNCMWHSPEQHTFFV